MNRMFNTGRIGAVAATLGTVLALGGASFALAQSSTDIGSSKTASIAEASEATSAPLLLGRSWVRWAQTPDTSQQTPLPPAAPLYSQVNFQSNGLATGGLITIGQTGQIHAEASMQLRKASGGGPATVTCDLRMSGAAISNEFVTTISEAGTSRVTMPLVGSEDDVVAGQHNVGVRCWATGNTVYMEKVDLHAVVYDDPF